ncbi:MAG: hypothetical protein FJ148_02620 [Deltaproteobacteria bacterium]|nr:hypothetical protein [Deltaproteobacteria bacterium]
MGGGTKAGSWKLQRVVAGALVMTPLLFARPTLAAEEGFLEKAGVGAGTALANVLYIPAKLTYATLGGLIGGFAWVLSLGDTDTAMGVWGPTMGGSYIVTPGMLRGKEPLEFSGETSADDGVREDEVVEEDITIKEYDTGPPE